MVSQTVEAISCVPVNVDSLFPSTTTTTAVENTYGIITGGKKKTASGTLRILVIFVRFKDDTRTNSIIWPNATVLPAWASTLVDDEIPSNNVYQNINLSNFFDRESGGNGNGTLGDFQVIGDIYYITTDENKSYYSSDAAVNQHVLSKLDATVNYKKYDNWKFMVGGKDYVHDYLPYNPTTGTGGDGYLDHIFIFWRDYSITYWARYGASLGGYASIETTYNSISDGVTIRSGDGSTQLDMLNKGGTLEQSSRPIMVSAHEYTHFLFGGGGNIDAHFDGPAGHGGDPGANIGNISRFALMTCGEVYGMCAYEKYRLGWLEPTCISSNSSSTYLYDTHRNNTAIMIPLRYNSSGDLVESYFIENFQTTNSYSGANPFKTKSLFNYTFTNGILVYHIEEEDLDYPTKTVIDLECADGLWDWALSAGTSTPSDRTDDVLIKGTPNKDSGLDERDYIEIDVGSYTYDDYLPLTLSSNPNDDERRRYNEDAWLGNPNDFFTLDNSNVFSKWSNPSTVKYGGTQSNFGFEIISYNTFFHSYTLKFGFDATTIEGFSPSKPQNFTASFPINGNPTLSWAANTEPDLYGYRVYKKLTTVSSGTQTTYDYTASTSYTDNNFTVKRRFGDDSAEYWVVAVDNTNKLSVETQHESTSGTSGIQWKTNEENKTNEVVKKYDLFSNYPNPFNPSTQITYQIPKDGFVSLVVYNSLGQAVKTLVNKEQSKGKYSISFNASNLPTGIYFYRIQASDYVSVKKMLLVK